MSVDILGTNSDQCLSTVQCCFMSTETVRLIRTESPGRPPLKFSFFFFPLLSLLIWPVHHGAACRMSGCFAMDSISGAAFGMDVNSLLDPNDTFTKFCSDLLQQNMWLLPLLSESCCTVACLVISLLAGESWWCPSGGWVLVISLCWVSLGDLLLLCESCRTAACLVISLWWMSLGDLPLVGESSRTAVCLVIFFWRVSLGDLPLLFAGWVLLISLLWVRCCTAACLVISLWWMSLGYLPLWVSQVVLLSAWWFPFALCWWVLLISLWWVRHVVLLPAWWSPFSGWVLVISLCWVSLGDLPLLSHVVLLPFLSA